LRPHEHAGASRCGERRAGRLAGAPVRMTECAYDRL
jgi:hypothetical protein